MALKKTTEDSQMDLQHILELTEHNLKIHIAASKTLNNAYSEYALQLLKLFEKGIDTFGSLEEFKAWLKCDNLSLHSKPIYLIAAIPGTTLVLDHLIRIDHGITV